MLVDKKTFADLESVLRYPEPNLRAGLELSSTGKVTACMDASDGPTACFIEIAEKSGVDIIIRRSALQPSPPVAEIARQSDIDPVVLMLTWGNWELVFTANYDELMERLEGNPIREEIVYIGDVVKGNGSVRWDSGRGKKEVTDISSRRFNSMSSFTHGIDAYYNLLQSLEM